MNAAAEGAGRPRVCLVTPGHLSTNPRLVKEAEALSGAGYEVHVVAARFLGWADAADEEFQDREWSVTRVGFGPFAGPLGRAHQGLRTRLLRQLFRLVRSISGLAEGAFHPVLPALTRAACRVRADLYVAHNLAALPAASRAAALHGARLGFDAEDFHLGELPQRLENRFARSLVRAIEQRYLPRCDYLTAASPGIAGAYAAEYGIEAPVVLLNVFPKREAPSGPTARGAVAPGPSVYWFSQTIGPDRGLECAVRAIGRAAAKPHLYLRGTPARGFLDRLQRLASEAGADGRVHVLPPANPAEMARLAAGYDLGLSGEPGHTPNNRMALGNKVFTYLLAGIPVAISDVPAHQALAPALGQAARLYPAEDAEGLAARLDEFLLEPARLAEARSAAWRLGQTRYNWDLEQPILLYLVGGVLREDVGHADRRIAAGDA